MLKMVKMRIKNYIKKGGTHLNSKIRYIEIKYIENLLNIITTYTNFVFNIIRFVFIKHIYSAQYIFLTEGKSDININRKIESRLTLIYQCIK